MRPLVTAEDVQAFEGKRLFVAPNAIVTPSAYDAACVRGIEIVRGGEEAPRRAVEPAGQPATTALSPPRPFPPEMATPVLLPHPAALLAGMGALRGSSPAANPTSSTSGNPSAEGAECVIVSAVGRNRPRVLAEITASIAQFDANILDISQRIVSGYFCLILIVDITEMRGDFASFKRQLEALGKPGDYKLTVQHERVFQSMHRI